MATLSWLAALALLVAAPERPAEPSPAKESLPPTQRPEDRPAHESPYSAFGARATPSNELGPEAPCYVEALREIQASDANGIYVAEAEGRLVGTFMLTFIRHLMRQGTLVAQVEEVRVDRPLRNRGYGAEM